MVARKAKRAAASSARAPGSGSSARPTQGREPAPAQSPAPAGIPTPATMRGRTDPARAVRPVDWTADGRSTATPGPGPAQAVSSSSAPRRPAQRPGATGATPSDRLPGRRPRLQPPGALSSPPQDAVHTLAPEDPRPLPRPLRVDEGEIRTVGVPPLRTAQIVEAVADPEDAWTADAGASDHFLRGSLVVQVRRADNAVIGAFSARYALSVRPDDYEPALDIAEDAAGPSARGGKGTRHPTSRRELLRRMETAGFRVTPGSTHGRVTHPDHPGLVVPFASTPSDRRFTRHAVAQIRRVFGIDLRH